MPETAYNLDYFKPAERPERKVRVAKAPAAKRAKSARMVQVQKTLKVVFTAMVLVSLVCAVLNTQTNVAELQSQIDIKKGELVEAEAYNAYLNFELESMTNIRNVEQRAAELGLVRVNNNQITYVHVNEDSTIQIKESPVERLLDKTRTGLLDVADHLSP